jgi:hypothetical protein
MRAAAGIALVTIATFAVSCVLIGCAGETRDVVPESRDVVKSDTQSQGSYTHVAKRAMGFVALAGEQGVGADVAIAAVEHLADTLDACATDLAQHGKLVDGAVRVRMAIAPDGAPLVSHVDVAPGNAVAANAILCVLAPLKLLTFPASDPNAGATARTMAIDATWGPPGARAPRASP